MGNNNRTRFYVVLLGVLLVFCEMSDCTICEFCGVDFVHLGKHVWHCKQRIQPVNHPTVDNPMRLPNTSTSLTNHQYNENHAHSIINEERPLNVNSAEQSLNNQNNNGDCYMKECGKLCKGLRGLKAHQRSCKVLDLPELSEMFQQPLLQILIVNKSDNISDDNNSNNEPDNEDLHNNVILKGHKLRRSKEELDSVNMAIQNDIKDIDEIAQQFQSSTYEYFLENFGSHENSNEDEFSVKYASYSKNRLKKVLKTLKNDEKSDLSEVTFVSRLLRSKLSKGEKSYQPNLDHSYKIRKNF